jgi:predicted ribosome quality control (RQC) complex YloA/Tae2 family protein
LSWARWQEILAPVPPQQRARALVHEVAWTSPVNARAFVDADDDPAVALERGWETWRALAHERRPTAPCLLEEEGAFQPYPWPLDGYEHERTETLLDAFRAWADRHASGGSVAAAVLPPERVEALERAVDTALRRATSLQAELDALEDPEALRARGDLLLARFAEVPPGAGRVELLGFDGERVALSLDPALAVQDNAAVFYDRASRAERGRARLPGLVRESRSRAATLVEVLERVRAGEATAEELDAHLPRTPVVSGRREAEAPTLPYRVFRSSGGLEIRVGRGARTNDDLTFHHSAPDDVWLHARHASGAHVVLRWGKPGNPPTRDLHEAAVLAALHSRARTSGTVPVVWTLRKYVRKPRGAAPGTVAPDRVRTLFVEPDPGLVERLGG